MTLVDLYRNRSGIIWAIRFKISYPRAAIEAYNVVHGMEAVSLLEVTAYLDIYDFFFLFKKKVSTASDNSIKNKIRKRVDGKNKEEYVARAFCQETRL